MKKTLLVLGAFVAIVVALGVAGFAYAQGTTPPTPPAGYGPGMMGDGYTGQTGPSHMGGRGGMMGGRFGSQAGSGPMHTYMVTTFAEALGIDEADLQARLDAGETMWDVALAEGLTEDEAWEVMSQARAVAFEAMVADGVLTAEQAERMESRMGQMQAGGYGPGSCPMHGGATGGQTARPGGRWGGSQPTY